MNHQEGLAMIRRIEQLEAEINKLRAEVEVLVDAMRRWEALKGYDRNEEERELFEALRAVVARLAGGPHD